MSKAPKISGPKVQGPFDPPVALEGPNNGLTEAFAEFLWIRFGGDGLHTLKESVNPMEADGWRRVALDAMNYLVGRGFRGPGGLRPAEPEPGAWDYAWHYDCHSWEILDGSGGAVCMAASEHDIPLILAAPKMAAAIGAALARFEARGGVTKADMEALRLAIEGVPNVRD